MTEPTADHICGRFYAPPEPYDYKFCYLPKGHAGECVFEPRRDRKTVIPLAGHIDTRVIPVKLSGDELALLIEEAVAKRLEWLTYGDARMADRWEDLAVRLSVALDALENDAA